MPGPLRMVIGPTKARLKKLLEEAEDPAVSQFVATDSTRTKTENIQSQKQFMFELRTLIAQIRSAVDILESRNHEWFQQLQTLPAKDRTEEEEIYK